MTEEEKRIEAIEEVLKLKPEESAIIVIKNNQHDLIYQSNYNVSDLGLLELASNILVKRMREMAIKSNISEEQELLGLREVLQTLEYEYINHYFKKEEKND